MEFPGERRYGPGVPEGDSLSKDLQDLAEQHRILDLEKGLDEWHIEHLKAQHTVEHLTGLKTREVFDRELAAALKLIRGELQEKRANAEPLKVVSLILIDLDYFKTVNDTLGHSAGDAVLKKIAEILIGSERASDTAARLGGEELGVVMPGASVRVAQRHAEDVRAKIEQLTFDGYPDLRVTASFGVVSSKSSTDDKVLFENADKALYKAKETGRNRVEVYTGESETNNS